MIELQKCCADIPSRIIIGRHKKNHLLVLKVICSCVVREMVFPNYNTLLNVRTVFPNINILFECIHTVELLLKSLFLLTSAIINYLKGEIVIFHPFTHVFLFNFGIHTWSDMYWLFPFSSLLLVAIKLCYHIVMIATESTKSITHNLAS